MRIIAGKYRGRRLSALKGHAIRPTASRVREALFNVLAHAEAPAAIGDFLAGQAVADICCGSGALGLEALSRGAASALFVDRDPAALEAARANAEHLGATSQCRFLRADAAALPPAPQSCATVFLDPPYREAEDGGFLAGALDALARGRWLPPGGLAVIERPLHAALPAPAGFHLLKERHYGKTKLAFLQYIPETGDA